MSPSRQYAGTAAGQGTVGFELNKRGNVTGWYIDSGNLIHGFLRAPNGTVTEFDAPEAVSTLGIFISPTNVISGYDQDAGGVCHGFLRNP